jgi:hypothetical protein
MYLPFSSNFFISYALKCSENSANINICALSFYTRRFVLQ